MANIARIVTLGLGSAALLGAAAVPYLNAQAVQRELTSMAEHSATQGDVMLRHLQHQAGYLSSKGSVEVVLRDRCHDDGEADTTFVVEYEAKHLPTLSASNRFEWHLRPTGQAAEGFKRLFGNDSPLSGQGQVMWSGQIRSDMKLPAVSYAADGERLEMEPSQGSMTLGSKALQLVWNLDRAVLRGKGHAIELKQLGVDMDLSNRQRGIGSVALRMASVSTTDAVAEGWVMKSVTREQGDKLDTMFSQSLQRVQLGDLDLKDLALEASLKGLHAQSVETLTTILGGSCGMEALTRDESDKVRLAIQTLLASGLQANISKLSGQGTKGGIDGQFELALKPTAPGQGISLANQLSSQGKLLIKGDLLPAPMHEVAINAGYARAVAEGLQAAFQFDKGLLKFNGRQQDASGLTTMLAMVDDRLLAYLQGKENPTALARAAVEEAEHEETEAQAPALAAGTDSEAPSAAPAQAWAPTGPGNR